MLIENRVEKAYALHKEGYNCVQAVIGAYIDLLHIDFDTAMNISYSLGGGVGMQREICGVLLGGSMVISMVHGLKQPDQKQKLYCYQVTGDFIEEFKLLRGSIRCGELIKLVACNTLKYGTCDAYIKDAIILLEKYVV